MLKHHENGCPFFVKAVAVGTDDVDRIHSVATTLDEAFEEIHAHAEFHGLGPVVSIVPLPLAGHRQMLAVYHELTDDPLLLVFCPPEDPSQEAFFVIDDIDGTGTILGSAISEDEAVLVANVIYDGSVDSAMLFEDVPVGDDVLPFAWVAMRASGSDPDTIRVTVDVTYDKNGEDIHTLAESVRQVIDTAIENGDIPVAFSDSPAESLTYTTHASVVISEEGDDDEDSLGDTDTDVVEAPAPRRRGRPPKNQVADSGPRNSAFDDSDDMFDAPLGLDPHGRDLSDLGVSVGDDSNWRFAA